MYTPEIRPLLARPEYSESRFSFSIVEFSDLQIVLSCEKWINYPDQKTDIEIEETTSWKLTAHRPIDSNIFPGVISFPLFDSTSDDPFPKCFLQFARPIYTVYLTSPASDKYKTAYELLDANYHRQLLGDRMPYFFFRQPTLAQDLGSRDARIGSGPKDLVLQYIDILERNGCSFIIRNERMEPETKSSMIQNCPYLERFGTFGAYIYAEKFTVKQEC